MDVQSRGEARRQVTQDITLVDEHGRAAHDESNASSGDGHDLRRAGVNEQGRGDDRHQKFDRVQSKVTDPTPVDFERRRTSRRRQGGDVCTTAYKAMTQGDSEVTMTARGEIEDVKVPQDVLTCSENSRKSDGRSGDPTRLPETIMQTRSCCRKRREPGEEWSIPGT